MQAHRRAALDCMNMAKVTASTSIGFLPDDEDPEATGATDRCEELEKPEGRTAGDCT